jgi:predicted nucleic acid-binding protein
MQKIILDTNVIFSALAFDKMVEEVFKIITFELNLKSKILYSTTLPPLFAHKKTPFSIIKIN